jgi:hypothetical protein
MLKDNATANAQVSLSSGFLACTVAHASVFVRDEEAAGSNPATPTSSEGIWLRSDRFLAHAE